MTVTKLAILLLPLAALAAVLVWRPWRTAISLPISIIISGDTAGWITPCGCTSNQSGGLLRRGSYINDISSKYNVIYADAGGAPSGVTAYHRIKFEAILKGELKMSLAAHNLGGPELALGPAALRDIASRLSVPFVCANATDADGQPLASPLRIVNISGHRLAIAGVVSPRYATSEVRISDPRQALLNYITGRGAQYDSLIILAYLPDDELAALAAAIPEADAIIGGPTGQSIAPHQVGPVLLASATNKGKFLIELARAPSGPSWSGTVVEMNDKLPDDSRQKQNVADFLAELARQDFPAAVTGFAPALSAAHRDSIAGTERCQACHTEDNAKWDATRHARGWDSLRQKGNHVDPYCQQCHATGYGQPGGFVSVRESPTEVSIGCEDCHGPSLAHVNDPHVHTPYIAKDQCVRCHDHENSPAYDYKKYWADIAHGQTKATNYSPSTYIRDNKKQVTP